MGINTIMENALKTQWNLTDDFDFRFTNVKYTRDLQELASGVGLDSQSLLDMCTMNIDLPQMSGDIDAVLHAGEYRFNAKKFQPFTISITFRDVLGLKLRDYFMHIFMDQQGTYFNLIKSGIEVYTKDKLIFESQDCLIASVSQVQFDNSNAQVTEFTIELQTPYYTNSDVINFGQTWSR